MIKKDKTMDVVLELKINNPSDWTIIERLLKRLKISFVQKNIALPYKPKEQTLLDELNALLEDGVDASYYGDPIAFQRAAREDVVHPLRN